MIISTNITPYWTLSNFSHLIPFGFRYCFEENNEQKEREKNIIKKKKKIAHILVYSRVKMNS